MKKHILTLLSFLLIYSLTSYVSIASPDSTKEQKPVQTAIIEQIESIEVAETVSQGRAFPLLYKGDKNATIDDRIRIIWQKKTIPLLLYEEDGIIQGKILLAMPTDLTQPQQLTIQINNRQIHKTIAPKVVKWKQTTLSVDPKYATPPQDVLDKIYIDSQDNKAIFSTYSDFDSLQLPLHRPVNGSISASFGDKRMFNGSTKSIHRGTDFRGPVGTPIRAVADGTVVLAHHQYYSGDVIHIDHGQGIYSSYAHLSKYHVKVGDKVKAGQKIAEIGMTGRVTGPHLHLGFIVQGISVDIVPLFKERIEVIGGPTPVN